MVYKPLLCAQAWITSLICKEHGACLYLVSVHQMAPPTKVANISLQLTTHLSTWRGWKAELTWLADLQWTVYLHKWLASAEGRACYRESSPIRPMYCTELSLCTSFYEMYVFIIHLVLLVKDLCYFIVSICFLLVCLLWGGPRVWNKQIDWVHDMYRLQQCLEWVMRVYRANSLQTVL